MKEILKCPFCGNKWNESVVKGYYNSYTGRMYFVECLDCGVTSKHYPTEEYAIKAWNKRIKETE